MDGSHQKEKDGTKKGEKTLDGLIRRGNFLMANALANSCRYKKERIVDLDPNDISEAVDFAALENDIHLGRMIGATHNPC